MAHITEHDAEHEGKGQSHHEGRVEFSVAGIAVVGHQPLEGREEWWIVERYRNRILVCLPAGTYFDHHLVGNLLDQTSQRVYL